MQLSNIVAGVLLGLATMSVARPISRPRACPDETLDLILSKKLPDDACCSYGSCWGHVQVSGVPNNNGHRPLNIKKFSENP